MARYKKLTWRKNKRGCYECTSHALNNCGYPRMNRNGIHRAAHRVIYENKYGPIPDGKIVMHKCDNRRCINPDHLMLGTHADNMRDMAKRGGARRGVLSTAAVMMIRKSKESCSRLARALHISASMVWRVRNGERRVYG